jgi:ATP:cob(I)alamin adenosyltransferase
MSIVTKAGDGGQTSLFCGERVSKDNLRVEVNGTLDELDCFLGDAKLYVANKDVHDIVLYIQTRLKSMMLEISYTKNHALSGCIIASDIQYLDDTIAEYERHIKLDGLIIPGNTIAGSKLDICRAIARRAERQIVSLSQSESISADILVYINRLSDLLFILARYFDKGV